MKAKEYRKDMCDNRAMMLDATRRTFEILKNKNEGTDEERAELVDSIMELLEGHVKLETSYDELMYVDGKLAGLKQIAVIQTIMLAVVLVIKFLC